MSGAPIAFVSDASDTGGAEFLAASLAAALSRRGRSVRFVVPEARAGEAWIRERLPGEAIVGAPLRNKAAYPLRALQAAADLPRIARVRAVLRALGPAAVIVNQADPEDGVATAMAARSAGIHVAALLHQPADPAWLGATRLLGPRRLLARTALTRLHETVIAVSAASAAEARATWGVDAVPVPNGIDLPAPESPGEREAARRELGIDGDTPVVAALGRLSEEKGFAALIGAMPLLLGRVPGARLVIAGAGPERGVLERAIREGALDGAVTLAGWRPSRAVILAADVVALPSRMEGMPLVMLEAGALARDVVACAVGGIPEVLDPSALAPAGDAGALTEILARSLADPERRAARAAALAEKVHREHGIDTMAARFEEALPW